MAMWLCGQFDRILIIFEPFRDVGAAISGTRLDYVGIILGQF